tara:strand:- start:1249 stop:1665 length:417 start_codon:yes stop_codon:yes gene_type:complete
MTSSLARWERYSPVSLGLEQMFNRLDTLTDSTAGNYPPYNIIRVSDTETELEIALAGFTKDEIEVSTESGVLTVKTNRESVDGREFTHRGLAQRTFAKNWQLSDDVTVDEVTYVNGLLTLRLRKEVPEAQQRKLLPIT